MLSMMLALSGSSVGRTYLSQQYDLLGDLITLLHTGSARVQRQVNYYFLFNYVYYIHILRSFHCCEECYLKSLQKYLPKLLV